MAARRTGAPPASRDERGRDGYGPGTPREERLATPTEDHPREQADVGGVIPAGEYGGGTVVVRDTGPFDNLTERDGEEVPLAEALADDS